MVGITRADQRLAMDPPEVEPDEPLESLPVAGLRGGVRYPCDLSGRATNSPPQFGQISAMSSAQFVQNVHS